MTRPVQEVLAWRPPLDLKAPLVLSAQAASARIARLGRVSYAGVSLVGWGLETERVRTNRSSTRTRTAWRWPRLVSHKQEGVRCRPGVGLQAGPAVAGRPPSGARCSTGCNFSTARTKSFAKCRTVPSICRGLCASFRRQRSEGAMDGLRFPAWLGRRKKETQP